MQYQIDHETPEGPYNSSITTQMIVIIANNDEKEREDPIVKAVKEAEEAAKKVGAIAIAPQVLELHSNEPKSKVSL